MRDPKEIDAAVDLVRADADRVGDRSQKMDYRFVAQLVVNVLLWRKDGEESEPFDNILDNMKKWLGI